MLMASDLASDLERIVLKTFIDIVTSVINIFKANHLLYK